MIVQCLVCHRRSSARDITILLCLKCNWTRNEREMMIVQCLVFEKVRVGREGLFCAARLVCAYSRNARQGLFLLI